MKEGLLIYGCYGYTGVLICKEAVKQGMKPTLAGRDEKRTKQLAEELHLPYLVFDLKDINSVANFLAPFKVALHCAGPFKFTTSVMANACLKARTHYLDITGEYQVFEEIFKLDEKAKNTGVMLMPGVGFDVVPSDCLAAHLKSLLPTADTLEMALMMKGGRLSHGTAITVAENMGEPTMIRKKSKLTGIPNGSLVRSFTVDKKKLTGVAISWGDISTAYRSTKIPNITVYNVLPQRVIDSMKMSNYLGPLLRWSFVKKYLIKKIKQRPAGPNDTERTTATSAVWGEVKNNFGVSKRAYLELPEGYTLTAMTAVKIAQHVLQNEPPAGSHTPSQVFGKDFILQFEGVKRTDLK